VASSVQVIYVAGLATLAAVASCVVAPSDGGSMAPDQRSGLEVNAGSAVAADPPAPSILSAVLLHDEPDPGEERWRETGRDVVTLVFSVPLDPGGMQAQDFLVIGVDERQALPARAVFAPSQESDELRAVTITGAFGDAGVASVNVIGALYDAEGRALDGASSDVEPPSAKPRVVSWGPVKPGPGRCEGAAAAVRLWWSRPVRVRGTVGPDVTSRVAMVTAADGSAIDVTGVDDLESADAAPDHVVDLCLAGADEVRSVSTATGAFTAG